MYVQGRGGTGTFWTLSGAGTELVLYKSSVRHSHTEVNTFLTTSGFIFVTEAQPHLLLGGTVIL